jgi:hypothetical protein
MKASEGSPSKDLLEWVKWANKYTDSIDPLVRSAGNVGGIILSISDQIYILLFVWSIVIAPSSRGRCVPALPSLAASICEGSSMEVEGAERRIGDRCCNVGRQLSTLQQPGYRRAHFSVRSIRWGVDGGRGEPWFSSNLYVSGNRGPVSERPPVQSVNPSFRRNGT